MAEWSGQQPREATLSADTVDIAIVGAGPYGLSLAAHLRGRKQRVRVFGSPMRFWSQHMPRGMCLKSEGFASDLFDPDARHTLKAYCAKNNIEYADVGVPVRIETFIDYAQAFQRELVPGLEDKQVTSMKQRGEAFDVTLDTGETLQARRVVVATGIMNFAYMPPQLAALPQGMASHTSHHSDLSRFRGRRVAVVGAGSSAVDMAALLGQAGAEVELIARRGKITFHDRPVEPRPLIDRLKGPRSGLGADWRSFACCKIPLVFHALPASLRLRAVERHLGPAVGWSVRDAVVGKMPIHVGMKLQSASAEGGKVQLAFAAAADNAPTRVEVDHVIAGTGFKVDLARLPFLDPTLRSRVKQLANTPILDRHFQSSVPGLFFVGAAAANSFGPLLRFAYGAGFASKQIMKRL